MLSSAMQAPGRCRGRYSSHRRAASSVNGCAASFRCRSSRAASSVIADRLMSCAIPMLPVYQSSARRAECHAVVCAAGDDNGGSGVTPRRYGCTATSPTGTWLVTDGALSAVIDFGGCGVGDRSCDMVIAWAFFSGPSRETFLAALPADAGTWARGRGWTPWKALIVLAREDTLETRHVIAEVLADHEATCASRLSLLSWLPGSITLSGG